MMKFLKVAAATLLVSALGAVAYGDASFDWPPETYAPQWASGGDEYSPPYQRNIEWTFATDPRNNPLPGNGADYYGHRDDQWKASDYVQLSGENMGWLQGGAGGLPQGIVGIWNISPDQTWDGEITFHIDNSTWPSNYKEIWIEADFAASTGQLEPDIDFVLDAGPGQQYSFDFVPIGDPRPVPGANVARQNFYIRIEPNPEWEELTILLDVPPNGFFFLDNIHIATQCIPEPSTFCLSGIALVGLVFWVCRRRKAR